MQKLLYTRLDELARSLKRRISVGLLGLGRTNKAALELLLGTDVDITVRQDGLAPSLLPNAVAVKSFRGIYEDVLIPSPSVRRERLTIPDSTLVLTDYDLLFDSKPEKLFLVSGSDGKSTTVALTSLLLSPTFPDVFTGGNIGVPLWQASREASAFLLELSSFTLRYTRPRGGRALLTNVTPNHLDWHEGIEEYEECKLGLILSADEPILNISDPYSERAARDIEAFCLVAESMTDDEIRGRYKTEHTVTIHGGSIKLDGEPLVSTDEVRRNERHNLLNLSSAIALSIGYTDKSRIAEVARSFRGLSERCEHFSLDGIEYVSSSIDTTPERTKTTLSSLSKRVRIILGGRGKGLPLDPLREVLKEYATRIAVYGEIGKDIVSFIESDEDLVKIPHFCTMDFDSAVDYVFDGIECGETVLLSPAATGYGEFRDYKERGEHFKEYIRKKHTH